MPEDNLIERAKVVAAARSYLRTPYHAEGRIRGAGVDCLTLIALAYEEAGIVINAPVPHYSPTFMLHHSEEQYLQGLLKYAHEVETPLPGDIVIWKFGRCFSHAAIVIKWPEIIHAYVGSGVTLENAEHAMWLKFIGERREGSGQPRPRKFLSYWSAA